MENILSEWNHDSIKSLGLPLDYGVKCASKSMKPLNDAVKDIIRKLEESED